MRYILDKNNRGNLVSSTLYGSTKVLLDDVQYFRFTEDHEKNLRLAYERGVLPIPAFSYGAVTPGTLKMKTIVDKIASVLFYAMGDENSTFQKEANAASKRIVAQIFDQIKISQIEIVSPSANDILFELRNYDYNEEMIDLLAHFNITVIEGSSVNATIHDVIEKVSLPTPYVHVEGTDDLAIGALLVGAESSMVGTDINASHPVWNLFSSNVGTSCLKDVVPVSNENAGGIVLGGEKTKVLFKNVVIRKNGKPIYFHSFRDGLGEWEGNAKLTQEGAIVDGTSLFLPNLYEEVEVEVEFKRISGEEEIYVGLGISDGYGVYASYGRADGGYKVAFDKQINGQTVKTICYDRYTGYSKDGNRFRLTYTKSSFSAEFYRLGKWNSLFEVKTKKVNERIFVSATFIEDDVVYLKIVNTTNEEENADLVLNHFGEKLKATIKTPNGEEKVLPIVDNCLNVLVPAKSIAVIVIE